VRGVWGIVVPDGSRSTSHSFPCSLEALGRYLSYQTHTYRQLTDIGSALLVHRASGQSLARSVEEKRKGREGKKFKVWVSSGGWQGKMMSRRASETHRGVLRTI